jgi:hypothetical protein
MKPTAKGRFVGRHYVLSQNHVRMLQLPALLAGQSCRTLCIDT